MEAFFSSTLAVSLAEIGDKTQLLALFLAARYASPYLISLGIFVATLLNHALSAWLGAWMAQFIPAQWFPWMISASFLLIALWLLIPDKADEEESKFAQYGPFLATLVLFFIAEIGDKTQIATFILAAKYNESVWMTAAVVAGTTLGMLIANIPVIFAGKWLMEKMPMRLAHGIACALFLALALVTLIVGQ
jgi:putative Ca2+/H+ antiporter (TMEM165/GDT1 family)